MLTVVAGWVCGYSLGAGIAMVLAGSGDSGTSGWVSIGAGGVGVVILTLIVRRVLASFDASREWAQDALTTERRLHREDIASFRHVIAEQRAELHYARWECDKWRREALGLEAPDPYVPAFEPEL